MFFFFFLVVHSKESVRATVRTRETIVHETRQRVVLFVEAELERCEKHNACLVCCLFPNTRHAARPPPFCLPRSRDKGAVCHKRTRRYGKKSTLSHAPACDTRASRRIPPPVWPVPQNHPPHTPPLLSKHTDAMVQQNSGPDRRPCRRDQSRQRAVGR